MTQKPTNQSHKQIKPGKTKYPELSPLWIGMLIDVLGFYIIIPYSNIENESITWFFNYV